MFEKSRMFEKVLRNSQKVRFSLDLCNFEKSWAYRILLTLELPTVNVFQFVPDRLRIFEIKNGER